MSSRKTRDDEIYERGVQDGQQADGMDRFAHSLSKGFTLDPRENEIYNNGFDFGLRHPHPKPSMFDHFNDQPTRVPSPSVSAGVSGGHGGESTALDGMDGNPIVRIGAVIGGICGLAGGVQAGRLRGGLLGAIFGMFGGALLGLAITIAIGLLIFYGVFWVLWKLANFMWSLG